MTAPLEPSFQESKIQDGGHRRPGWIFIADTMRTAVNYVMTVTMKLKLKLIKISRACSNSQPFQNISGKMACQFKG